MTSAPLTVIHSRDNAFVKDLRRLSQDSTAYRKQGRVWLEGDHLCSAALQRGVQPAIAVFSESFWPIAPAVYAKAAIKVIVVADALFADISGLESPAVMGFLVDTAAPRALQSGVATVVLDRVQDAGNVGSILRSASAFGFRQVAALKGSAAVWAPKVARGHGRAFCAGSGGGARVGRFARSGCAAAGYQLARRGFFAPRRIALALRLGFGP